jgi:RNA polymerase-binding transcription factor
VAVAKKKSTAKQAAAKKKPAKKQTAAKKASAKKAAPAKKTSTATKKSAATKPAKKQAATKKAATSKPAAGKKAAAKKAPAGKKAAATGSKTGAAADTTKAAAKKSSGRSRTAPAQRTPRSSARKALDTPTMSTTSANTGSHLELPKPRFNKDGFGYTKDFDLAFIKQMHDALQAERIRLTGQAKRLEDEAHQLVEEAEMGDVQFDDEGGEGDTMVVERERDLALSAQAREAVEEIDAALLRIMAGTYGYSTVSGRPIPRERLEAIPWSTELVEEKVGGIGR